MPLATAHVAAFVGGRVPGREAREAALDAQLAPGATRPHGAGRRKVAEEPDPYRLCFERDLDRVKHSRPWRRLAGKCQVFVAPEDDHLRTRLTHAVEVAQIATGIARVAGLCVPLTEAIALAHDCGHGPAGHASEEAFSPYLAEGYDHAVYGADVTLAGLNLCEETLDGVRNHSWRRPPPATPEGEVVAWADRIAYVCHDFEDAISAGILVPDDLPAPVADVVGRERRVQLGRFVHAVLAAIDTTGHVGMRPAEAEALAAFRSFNFERIYLRPAARRQAERVVALLRGLVDCFVDTPGRLPGGGDGLVAGTPEAAASAVAYVSGMTDRYALALGVELLGWRPEDLPRGV
jgi:dGTPase